MATLPADLDAVTSLPTAITANVTAGHEAHSEMMHKALQAIRTAWTTLATTGTLDNEAVQDLVGAFIVVTAPLTKVYDDAANTLTLGTTATVNSTDAFLLARANHTGTQDPVTTLANWVEAVVDAVAPAFVGGTHTNGSFAYNDATGFINFTGTGGGGGGSVASTGITDSTTFGRAVITAATALAARTAIGAGTSSLVLGTAAGTAKAGDYAPTATDIGLGNVTNTADVDKPVSTAQATAIALKAEVTHTHATSQVPNLAEFIRDTMNTAVVAGPGITVVPSDAADTLTIDFQLPPTVRATVVTASHTVNNSVTMVAHPEMTITAHPAGTYKISAKFFVDAPTAVDVRMVVGCPTGSTVAYEIEGLAAAATVTSNATRRDAYVGVTAADHSTSTSDLGTYGGLNDSAVGVNKVNPITITGTITLAAAGDVSIKYAQGTLTAAAPVKAMAGSFLELEPVA